MASKWNSYLFSFTKLIQVSILEEVKVIFKPSICLQGFIWWLLKVEMTTHGTFIPSGRKFSHSCTYPSIVFPEAHQPPSVMSANCLSLSCPEALLVLHAGTVSSQGAVAIASSTIMVGVESEVFQTIYFFRGPVFFCCQWYIWPRGHRILMVICQALAFTSKVPPNSWRILAIQWPHV